MVTAAMKLKRFLLGRRDMTNLDSILKSRDITLPIKICLVKAIFFSNTHVWMWELDHKEGWAPKNWCFWTVVLEKTFESPLDSKETKPVNTKGKFMTNLDSILKSRVITLLTKVCIVKAMFFSNTHVWMWELDHKESWVLKNWCFWTVVLEKTLESPLDCKEIQPVHPKGNQSWMFIGRTVAEAETPVFGHLMWRTDSLEKTLMPGKIEGGRRRGQWALQQWPRLMDREDLPGQSWGERTRELVWRHATRGQVKWHPLLPD